MRDEERALWDVYVQTGRPVGIRDRLVAANEGLVGGLMKRFSRKWAAAEQEDLRQELLIKLWECVETYDPSRGYKFSTYATRCLIRRGRNYMRGMHQKGRAKFKVKSSAWWDVTLDGLRSKESDPGDIAAAADVRELAAKILSEIEVGSLMEKVSLGGERASRGMGVRQDPTRNTAAHRAIKKLRDHFSQTN